MIGPSRPRPALLGVLIGAVFIAGVAVGVISDRLAGTRRTEIRTRIKAGAGMSSVLDRLDLTAEQRVRADSIVSHQAPRSEDLMIELADRLKAVSDSIDAQLRAILTPAQRLRLDSLRVAEPKLMLKRKVVTPGRTTVDTVFPGSRDSAVRR